MAMLGSDGRYYLVRSGSTVPCDDHEHSQRVHWATDGLSPTWLIDLGPVRQPVNGTPLQSWNAADMRERLGA